ncbi:MAG TPA: hypothetical protein VFC23_12665 [Thermoanaerobaculia bacterium]|nr:hypothetical protein [Thermoanaerobaculia bacterium]
MRELTKSMLSFSWALPLFGMKQMMDMALPRDPSRPFGRATDSFDAVTGAAQDQLGNGWNAVFRAGDQLQRGMVDLMFSFFSPDAWNPNRMMQMTSDVMQRSMGAAGQMVGNCGCGPASAAATGTRSGTGSGAGSGTGTAQPQAGWGPIPSAPPAPSAAAPSAAAPSFGTPSEPPSSTFGPPAGWKVSAPSGV